MYRREKRVMEIDLMLLYFRPRHYNPGRAAPMCLGTACTGISVALISGSLGCMDLSKQTANSCKEQTGFSE